MIIVSDPTPLRDLIEIEKTHILESLFGHTIIPEKVAEVLQRRRPPQKVSEGIHLPIEAHPDRTIYHPSWRWEALCNLLGKTCATAREC